MFNIFKRRLPTSLRYLNHAKVDSEVHRRTFYATAPPHVFKAAWMPMRVKTPFIDALTESREQAKRGGAAGQDVSAPKPDLTPRRMSDSYFAAVLPLAQDKWLLDQYLNASGRIRLGSLFMDLDAMAGVIAYRHTGDSVMTVTAAADRISLLNPLKEICDLELSGRVTYATGRSSMEVSMQVAKAPKDGQKPKPEDVLLSCAFTMVSLDPVTKKPVAIAPIRLETEEERRLFQNGEENYKAKKAARNQNLQERAPNDEEADMIHAMWKIENELNNSNIPRPDNIIPMSSTKLESTMLMQPEDRNRHNFMIFGGFLLKHTFELAFCCASSFAKGRPTFISLDPSTFENPVPVGSMLYLRAVVAYTDPPLLHGIITEQRDQQQQHQQSRKYTRVQVRVESQVRDIETGQMKPTGVFNYTFIVPKEIHVMPKTYAEFMVWVDARRRAMHMDPSLAEKFPEFDRATE